MSVLGEMKMGLRSLVDQHGPEVALCAKVVVKTLLPGGHFIAEGVEALCDYAAEQRQNMTEEGLFEVLGDLQRDQAHISALVKVLSERFEEVIDDLSVDVDLEAPREEHLVNLTRQCERLLSRTTELEDVRREVVSWQPKFSSIQEQLRQQSDALATHYDKLTSELGETRELLNTVAELTMSHYEPLSRDGLTSKQRITFSQAHSAFQEAYIASELAEMETSLEVMKGVDPYHPTFKICQLAHASLSGALDQLPQLMDTLPSQALQSERLQRLIELSSPQGRQEEPKETTPLTEEELREAELCLGEGGWELAPAKDQTEWALENLNAGWLLGARSQLRRGERWRVMSSEGASGSLQLFQGQLAKSGAFYERFDDELKRLSALNHPSIMKVLEWGRHEDKTPYVITEPLEGESLSERLERGYLSPEEMKSLGVKLTESLQACHEQGVLHRYIHPDHILLKGNGEAMLTHFGVTSPQGVDELMGVRRSDEYASPEQKQGRVVTSASDLYSLGVVLTNSVGGLKAVPRAWRPQIERMTSPFPSERPSAEEGHQLFNELTSSYYLCPPNEPSWGPLDADEVARWIADQLIKEALPPHFKLQQRGTLSAQPWRSFDEVKRRVRSYLSQHFEERASQAQPAPSQTISSETVSSEMLNSETSSASESVQSEPAQESNELQPLSFEERVIPASPSAPSFLMMETQVTQALWEEVMGSNPSHFKGPRRPVEQVSWFDCVRFANALSLRKGLTPAYEGDPQAPQLVSGASGFRLPFEVEWEFAARGGQGCTFAGSNNLSEVGWYNGNSSRSTQDVGQLKPNAYGLYDMSGNVWEWCSDHKPE